MTEILSKDVYAPYCEVKIKGKTLPDTALISVSVDENLDTPAAFELTFNETMDVETQQFTWLESPYIEPGNLVDIYFGYVDKKNKKALISGTIKAINPGFQSSGTPGLTVAGYDISHKMKKKVTGFNGVEVKYSDIAKEIAGKYKLGTSGVEDSGKKHDKVEREKGEKDYELLRRLANDLDFEFFIQGKDLYFRKPGDGKKQVKTFQLGQNLISFSPRLSMAPLVHEVEVTGWDVKAKKTIKETVKLEDVAKKNDTKTLLKRFIRDSEGLEAEKIENKPLRTKEEARKKAEVALKKALKPFIEGDLECIGDPLLRAGDNVEIKGVGTLFSGLYYIKSARHSFGENGYRTTLGVRRNVL
jgi:phage protein D